MAFTCSICVPFFIARRVGCRRFLPLPAFAVNERTRAGEQTLASRTGRAVFTTAEGVSFS